MTKDEVLELLDVKVPRVMFKNMVADSFKSMTQLLINRGEEDQLIRRVRDYAKNKAMDDLEAMLTDSFKDKSTIKTITHGDLWSNNMMFSKDETGKVQAVKLLDYQMMGLFHPARWVALFNLFVRV